MSIELRQLIDHDHDAPFVSVYFDDSHDTEDAARRIELRRQAIHDELSTRGAPASTVAAVDEAVVSGRPARGRSGRALIAAGGQVLVDQRLTEPPAQPLIRLSELPYLLPLMQYTARRVPHVLAVVDSTGADLHAVDRNGVPRDATVRGPEHAVHKARGGGWAHWPMQRRSEEAVRRNVATVARRTERLVDEVHAAVLLLAGEVKARSALRDAVAAQCDVMELGEGGRAAGSDADALAAAVDDALRRKSDDDAAAILQRFDGERRRRDGLAVTGLAPTSVALRTANVEQLVVDPRELESRTVHRGADPMDVTAAELPDHPLTYRADEALPWAALAEGADIVTTTPDARLPDGIGALLRHG